MTTRMTVKEFRQAFRDDSRTKPRKYRNKPTEYNGITYASKREADQAARLDLLVLGGAIQKIERQVRFKIAITDKLGIEHHICTYVCDFRVTWSDGQVDVIDAKGFLTPAYRLKKRLMSAVHGIEIVEC